MSMHTPWHGGLKVIVVMGMKALFWKLPPCFYSITIGLVPTEKEKQRSNVLKPYEGQHTVHKTAMSLQ